ncbi:hypothetical protein B0H19DRAFT_1245857 [Mycena capillaripes]|nr:hypothetical protein B0H19DRAFT_1245857 [Mycena capillaripes]
MAVPRLDTRSLPIPRRMRPIRLVQCKSPLNRWLASVEFCPDYDLFTPLPNDCVMFQAFVVVLESVIFGTIYRLSVVAYDRRAGRIAIRLARYVGSPDDSDAPLWVRRLPPYKRLRFTQPRSFAVRLVAGMTDIPVDFLDSESDDRRAISARRLSWARDAAVGTPSHRILSRRCKNVALGNIKAWARGKNLRGF